MSFHRNRLAALLLVGLTACGDEATTTPVPDALTPAAVVIADPGVVREGDVITLRAEARTAAGRVVPNVNVRWASVDPTIAAVTESGTLTALREGTTEIVATAGALQQRRVLNVVLHPAVSLELQALGIDLLLGTRGGVTPTLRGLDGRLLTNRPITFESSNDAVVRVTSTRELIPVSAGTALITARYGGLSATMSVRVLAPVMNAYTVRAVNDAPLPFVLSDEVVSDNGFERVREITRIESGSVTIGDPYAVTLQIVHLQRSEIMGNTGERVLSRQTIRDQGRFEYNPENGSGLLRSTLVGGLTHVFEYTPQRTGLWFRLPGTTTILALGLRLP
jgi:hypothetical protein